MAKFIKLTNIRADIRGSSLYFNSDQIICVYDMDTENGEKTFLYGGATAQTWEIEETAKQVVDMINGSVDD